MATARQGGLCRFVTWGACGGTTALPTPAYAPMQIRQWPLFACRHSDRLPPPLLPLLVLGVALCLVLILGAVTHAGPAVVNPRLTTEASLDTTSAASVVRQLIRPGMTDEAKVLACWRFMLDHFYHWHPPQEESVPAEVRDFAKAINSYGYGPCFVNTPLLIALWESAGFEARAWRVGGHTVAEVRYDGSWHMLDADARGWHRGPDGRIASVADLAGDPDLFLRPAGRSDPYYPFALPDVAAAPLKPWSLPSRMMDLFASVEDNQILNHRAVTGHPMYLTLRPGEVITLAAGNRGAWNRSGPWYDPQRLAAEDAAALQNGPVDSTGNVRYGNGELLWQPDLSREETRHLLWLGTDNVRTGKGGVRRELASRPAVAVFRVWSPYVMVGGLIRLRLGSALASYPCVEMSTDGGYGWQPLSGKWRPAGEAGRQGREVDVGPQVAGKYEYLLRVHLEEAPLAAVEFATTFQLAPLSLPRLRPGNNRVTVSRGPDEGHVQLVLGEKQVGESRYHAEVSGAMAPGRLEPQMSGRPCAVVFRLTAPAALTAIAVGGHLTLERAADQFVESSFSLDQGQTWQPVWRQVNTGNSQDQEFEIDKWVALVNPGQAREALIRFTLQRNSPVCAVTGIRLYGFYRESQPERAGLKVRIVWQERQGTLWRPRELPLSVSRFPHAVEVVCGGEEVRLERIRLEP